MIMVGTICPLLCMAAFGAFAALPNVHADAGSLELARRGGSAHVVMIGKDCDPAIVYAAEELRDYVRRLTDVEMRIVRDDGPLPERAVILGPTRYAADLISADGRSPRDDGFRLFVTGERLVVSATVPRGVLYGIYELLERFGGCAWYSSWCEHVPRLERFAVPRNLDECHEPAFAMRVPAWQDVLDNPQFATRLRVNSLAGFRANLEHDRRFGNGDFRFSDHLRIAHTFFWLLPPDLHFAQHPEYYSLVGGRRKKDGQLCLSNPDVVRLVTDRVIEEIRRDPTARFYGISQNDNMDYCQCSRCAAIDAEEGSHAGSLVRFLNAVAEAVERVFPEAKIETLAYTYSRRPPAKTRLRHNVVPCLCSIECDFSRPIAESPYHENRTFTQDIQGWSGQTKEMFIWDYTTDFFHYPMTFANVRSLRENLRFFRRHGIRYVFEQGDYQGAHGNFAELKSWLLAKWMWNPDLDEESLLSAFFAGYYGDGARLVRQYFDEAHQRQQDYCSGDSRRALGIYDGPENPAYSDDDLLRWEKLLAEALAKTRDDPIRSYNVRMSSLGVAYTRLQRLRNLHDRRFLLTGHAARQLALPEMQRLSRLIGDRISESRHPVVFDERPAGEKSFREALARLSGGGTKSKDADNGRLVVSSEDLHVDGDAALVALSGADGGKVLCITGTPVRTWISLPFNWVGYESGRQLRLRVRLKAENMREGDILRCGVKDYARWNDDDHGEPVLERRLSTVDIGRDFSWHDVGAVIPSDSYYFYLTPDLQSPEDGREAAKVWVEAVEMSVSTSGHGENGGI